MTKRLLALAVVSLFMLPALMAQTFEFRYHGESLADGATVTVAAAIDDFDEMSCGTNPYNLEIALRQSELRNGHDDH